MGKAEAAAPLAHLPGFGGRAGPEPVIDRQNRQPAGRSLRSQPQQGHRIGSAGDGQRNMGVSRDRRGQQARIRLAIGTLGFGLGALAGLDRLGIFRGLTAR